MTSERESLHVPSRCDTFGIYVTFLLSLTDRKSVRYPFGSKRLLYLFICLFLFAIHIQICNAVPYSIGNDFSFVNSLLLYINVYIKIKKCL